jgi:hypothetical protein
MGLASQFGAASGKILNPETNSTPATVFLVGVYELKAFVKTFMLPVHGHAVDIGQAARICIDLDSV